MSNAYLQYRQNAVLGAGPLQLVVLLYDKAISSLSEARRHLAAQDIAARCQAVSKTLEILNELLSSLNQAAWPEGGERLAALYGYCSQRLLDAQWNKSDEHFSEVQNILETLRPAWKAGAQAVESGESAELPEPALAVA